MPTTKLLTALAITALLAGTAACSNSAATSAGPTHGVGTAAGGGSVATGGTAGSTGAAGQPTSQPVTPAGTTTLPRACTLLTKVLAASVIGASARLARDAQPNPHETQCEYTSNTGVVNVLVGPWTFINPVSLPNSTKVSGIGDEASVSASGLVARHGQNGISVLVAVAGSFSGPAANKIEAKQARLEKRLASKLIGKV